MTTDEAFEHLTSQWGWYQLCNIKESTARSYKSLYKKGRLSTDKIHQLLQLAGYTVKTQWKEPKKQKNERK